MVPPCSASVNLPRYSRGQCTGWRRRGAGVVHWRVLGKSSVSCPRCRVLGCPARPRASQRRRAQWRPRWRLGWSESARQTPRCGSARAAPPLGPSLRSSVCAGSAAAAGTSRRNRSREPALLFRTQTAVWRNFLKRSKNNSCVYSYIAILRYSQKDLLLVWIY